MIEIARVEPKKIQRKLLTEKQKIMCAKVEYHCDKCPMRFEFDDESFCYKDVGRLERAIKDYWNEEIEIDEECL